VGLRLILQIYGLLGGRGHIFFFPLKLGFRESFSTMGKKGGKPIKRGRALYTKWVFLKGEKSILKMLVAPLLWLGGDSQKIISARGRL